MLKKTQLAFMLFFSLMTSEGAKALEESVYLEAEDPPILAQMHREKAMMSDQKALWLTLENLSQAELDQQLALSKPNSERNGWLKLELISRLYRNDPRALLGAINQWQRDFYAHPANQCLANPLNGILTKLQKPPEQIALLLPLSGDLALPGSAIRDGFMAAHKANASNARVSLYDTNQVEATESYQQAIKDGADFVIGPLTKAEVSSVAALAHPIPTLLLNDPQRDLNDNAYAFGLSPLNEASLVAMKASAKGYRRALVIAPKNPWGNQIRQAFCKQWEEQGGTLVDTLLYTADDDMNQSMQDFLQITQSQIRGKQIKQFLGQNVQTNPARRQDFDLIFLLAYPSKARQIVPLLHYYYVQDVPIYATSSAYSGIANALKDKDLDGLILCDLPWVFSHQLGTSNWPEQWNSYNRLYALGMDSFALSMQMNHMILFPANKTMTEDILFLKSKHQIASIPEWGRFEQGLLHSSE